MPPTAVADKTLKGKGSGTRGETLPDLLVGFGGGAQMEGLYCYFCFCFFT